MCVTCNTVICTKKPNKFIITDQMSTSHLFVFRIHRPVLSSFALSDHVYSSTFTNRGRQTTFNGPFSGTTQVSRYQKGKTNLDFTEARDSEWQWLQLGHMQSAPHSRQITMPATHHSVFYRADALPATQPTASKH